MLCCLTSIESCWVGKLMLVWWTGKSWAHWDWEWIVDIKKTTLLHRKWHNPLYSSLSKRLSPSPPPLFVTPTIKDRLIYLSRPIGTAPTLKLLEKVYKRSINLIFKKFYVTEAGMKKISWHRYSKQMALTTLEYWLNAKIHLFPST